MNTSTLMFRRSVRATRLHPLRDDNGHETGTKTGSESDADNADDNDSSDDSDDDGSGDDKGSQGAKKTSKDNADDDQDDWKSKSRTWEGRAKATNKQLEAVKKALGLSKDDNLDPKELAEKLGTSESKSATLLRENAVLKAAPAGVDVEQLLDSKTFERLLDELDPEDDKFRAKVKALVEKEIERRPSLKSGGAKKGTTRSGTAVKGEGDAKSQLTRADLAKMSPEEIVKAQNEGRLKDLMGG